MKKDNMLSITEVRKKLYPLVKECVETLQEFILVSKGKAVARIISEEEYESLMETLEVLSDKAQIERLIKALKQAQKSKLLSHKDVFGHAQPK